MAGGRRRHAKRPAPVQPLPLAPGANRFQPSEAYLARISQQSASLTPATSPAFWPPVATPHQATAPAQPSAAARWVQEQERVHETSGFAPPPSVARSASEDVEQHSRHASMYSDIVPAPPARRPSPAPAPESSTPIDGEVYDELYGELYGNPAGEEGEELLRSQEPPTNPPGKSSSSSSHSVELYPDEQASHALASTVRPSTKPTKLAPTPPVDYIPFLPTSDHTSESDDSEEDLIQERLVCGFDSAQAAENAGMDSEDELYGYSRPEEITIHDDDSEIEHEEHHSERDSSPEQPFDFGAESDQHDDEMEDSYLLEGDPKIAEQAMPALPAPNETVEPSPKRRRLSADDSIEVLELSDSEENGAIDENMAAAGAVSTQPQGSFSTSAGVTAPQSFGGLSRIFTFGSLARDSPLTPVTSTDTASAQSGRGLLRPTVTARRQRSSELNQLESSRARVASSTRPYTTTAPLQHGAAASLAASDSYPYSQVATAAEATSATAALGARDSVQYSDVDMNFSGAPSDLLGTTSSPATAPISIQPITIPRARERATYQRRVDLSSTPVGTPVIAEAQVRIDRGKVTYRPSPLQPAPIHHAAQPVVSTSSVTGKAAYVRAGEQSAPRVDSAALTSEQRRAHAAKGRDAARSAYDRASKRAADSSRLGPKIPGQLPLSAEEKAHNLPAKFLDAFPSEFSDDAPSTSAHLYCPATLATAAAKALPPPDKEAHFGFWPAPPPLVSGKGLWPPPRPLPGVIAPEDDKRPPVHIFIDNSNVLYAFLNWVRARPEARLMSYLGISDGRTKTTKAVTLAGKKVKLDYATLFAILERGRKVEKRVLVASSALWQSLELAIDWGYEISLLQRVPRPVVDNPSTSNTQSKVANGKQNAPGKNKNKVKAPGRAGSLQPGQPGFGQNGAPQVEEKQPKAYKEQAVDELIHMKILESLLDYSPTADTPRPLLVVVSGDAKSSEYNPAGFLGPVRRALDRGWDVEIMSFASGTSSSWAAEEKRARGEESGGVVTRGKLRIVDLEKFAEELVL